MTNAIEQTKREMYEALAILKGRIEINYSIKNMLRGADEFELALQDHLEAMRLELEYERKRSNDALEDRDAAQLRMQAIDHAYNEQQSKTGTCGQVCGDRGASEQPATPDANIMAILGAVIDCQQLVSDWAVYGYRAKKQMKKMAYVLNNNPELRAALDHFEGRS